MITPPPMRFLVLLIILSLLLMTGCASSSSPTSTSRSEPPGPGPRLCRGPQHRYPGPRGFEPSTLVFQCPPQPRDPFAPLSHP
jgi:hypothetical protein